MYCTILPDPLSTRLDDDAGSAYHRLRREARTLGTISGSFDALATNTTAAFLAALTHPTTERWTMLVSLAALFASRVESLHGIVALDANERAALAFFWAIANENADLLGGPEPFAGSLNFSSLARATVAV